MFFKYIYIILYIHCNSKAALLTVVCILWYIIYIQYYRSIRSSFDWRFSAILPASWRGIWLAAVYMAFGWTGSQIHRVKACFWSFRSESKLTFVCKKMFCVSIKTRYSWNPVVEIQMFPKFHGHKLWLIKIKQNTNHSMQAAFYRFILPGPVWRCLRQDVGNFLPMGIFHQPKLGLIDLYIVYIHNIYIYAVFIYM